MRQVLDKYPDIIVKVPMHAVVCISDILTQLAIKSIIRSESDFTVTATDRLPTAQALDGLDRSMPDVVVCTPSEIRAANFASSAGISRAPMVVLLSDAKYPLIRQVLQLRIVGLHCLSCHLPTLPDTLRVVGGGEEAWFAPCIAASIAAHISGKDASLEGHGTTYDFTPREALILKLLTTGSSNAEIALKLNVGIRTVKHHMSMIFRKIGARNRSEAVALAYMLGLVA